MGQWGPHTHESDKAHDLLHDLKLMHKGDMRKVAASLLIGPCEEEMRSRFTMYDIAGVALMLLRLSESVIDSIPRTTLAAVDATLKQQLPSRWKDSVARRKAIASELAIVRSALKRQVRR
jgi:hypothetical protein